MAEPTKGTRRTLTFEEIEDLEGEALPERTVMSVVKIGPPIITPPSVDGQPPIDSWDAANPRIG